MIQSSNTLSQTFHTRSRDRFPERLATHTRGVMSNAYREVAGNMDTCPVYHYKQACSFETQMLQTRLDTARGLVD
jgi:hypothetical protein